MNATIGEKRTFDDWGLKLYSLSISEPETKTNQIDIPGADGGMDLTEVLGRIRYENRELSMVFDAMWPPEQWHSMTSRIANYLHGQRLRIILDSEPDYYYIGRLSLNSEKSSYLVSRITISGDMEPYKYDLLSSLDDWLWDPFNFETGVVREYKNLAVNGSLKVVVVGSRKEVIPTFISNAAMQVEWNGVRYSIPAGESKNYSIAIPDGEHTLLFYGHGTVSINYRGGIL